MTAPPPTSTTAVLRLHPHAGITRRRLLSAMAASMALANGACSPPSRREAHPWANLPEAGAGALPLYYATSFVRGGYAHGVLVGTQEGRPIKVEGNPAHPASLGATDAYAQASVLQLWDPDRSAVARRRAAGAPPGASTASSWAEFEQAWRARPRGGLHVLTGPLTSPTERALLAALLAREPGARWHVHAPGADAAAAEGTRIAFGRDARPIWHLDRARCVLALGADPFAEGPGAVRQAMDWARARSAARDAGALPAALLAAEVAPGLFGARADRRVALAPARIEQALRRIAAPWVPEAGTPPATDPAVADFERRTLAALHGAGADSVVIAGPDLSREAHALVLALNQRLGAVGRGVDFIPPPDAAPDAGTLAELVDALHAGTVVTLLVLGANPAFESPGALEVASALPRARLLVHAGLHVDETAALADWHLPLSHAYEQWGDALAHDGTASLQQPAIAPLYDTRSTSELLALLADDPQRDGRGLVRRQWQRRTRLGAAAFEGFWQESVRSGVIANSAFPALALPAARVAPLPASAPPPLVARFASDPATHGGEYANNGWLQELPRPFSKHTWDTPLLMGPRTARRLGLGTGDVVQAEVFGRALRAPVWVEPLHAEDVFTLPLGGGRRAAGHVGDGVGVDAWPLRPVDAALAPLAITRTDARHAFATTQKGFSQEGRELVRTLPPGAALAAEPARAALYPPFASPVHAWAMSIDLDTCIGCNACTIACQAENNIPVVGRDEVERGRAMHWIRVDRYEGTADGGSRFQPVPCMHCEEAPCELVCPVGATVHDSEGLNVQVYNRCIGTRFCSNNCPYKVRRFNFLQFSDKTHETLAAQRNPDVTVRDRGVMEKCSYCVQRVARARQHAERTGVALVDGDVVTACQGACPTRAIRFGDLNDPGSDVVHAKASPRHYALLGELNTRPRTTYLARVEAKE